MSTERVVMLCGPPGSGKTTLGRALGEKSGWRFVEASTVVKEIFQAERHVGEEYLEYVDRVFASADRTRFVREIARACVAGAGVVIVAGLRLVAEVEFMRNRFPSSLLVYLECDAVVRQERKRVVDPLVALPVSARDAIEERWQSDDIRDIADELLNTERPIDVCVDQLSAMIERRLSR